MYGLSYTRYCVSRAGENFLSTFDECSIGCCARFLSARKQKALCNKLPYSEKLLPTSYNMHLDLENVSRCRGTSVKNQKTCHRFRMRFAAAAGKFRPSTNIDRFYRFLSSIISFHPETNDKGEDHTVWMDLTSSRQIQILETSPTSEFPEFQALLGHATCVDIVV